MSTQNWLTTDMEKGGEAYWLTRLCTKTINGIRTYGLPSDGELLEIKVPTLADQASAMYIKPAAEDTAIKPTGNLKFIDAVDDV